MATRTRVNPFVGQGEVIAEGELPPDFRRELAQIRDDGSVLTDSVQVRKLTEDNFAVCFRMRTASLSGEPACQIDDEEPVALLYTLDAAGSLAAPLVFMDRPAFPRNLPHVNPVPDDWPVSACLTRGGHQTLYERRRIGGILEHLDAWLRDAKTDGLNRDGWEPLPVGRDPAVGILNAGACQDFVEANRGGSDWALGYALAPSDDVVLLPHESLLPNQGCVAEALVPTADSPIDFRPLVLLWTPGDTEVGDPVFRNYRDSELFRADLARLGMGAQFDAAIGQLLVAEWPLGPISVVLAVRRPMPLLADIPGLSSNHGARSLELRAYQISCERVEHLVAGPLNIRPVTLMHPQTRSLARDVSGATPTTGAVLLGYGALGSALGGFLARIGTAPVDVIDNDLVLPHNSARHAANCSFPKRKADLHREAERSLFPEVEVTATGHNGLVQSFTHTELEKLVDDRLVLDTTASELVRRYLCSGAGELRARAVRAELFDTGRLGVLYCEGEQRNPDLLDLYYTLCGLGVGDPAVARWQAQDRAGSDTAAIATGMSCSSPTTRLPYWIVHQHAAAFMASIQPMLEGTPRPIGIGINALDDQGHPARAWTWYEVEPFAVLASNGWTTRISGPAAETMKQLARAGAPNESGGYLYGAFDSGLRRITVVYASPLPPGSEATPASLVLGAAGHTEGERALLAHCATRLELVGSWHSHPPLASTDLSDRDKATAAEFHSSNQRRGLPTLLAVVCGDEIASHVLD